MQQGIHFDSPPKNIFVLHERGMGDLMMLLPLLRALKKAHPYSRLGVTSSKAQAELSCLFHKGGIIDYMHANSWERRRGHLWSGVFGAVRQQPDIFISLSMLYGLPIPGLRRGTIDIRPIVNGKKPLVSFVNAGSIPQSHSAHFVDQIWDAAEYLGLPKEKSFDIAFPAWVKRTALEVMARNGYTGKETIAIIPYSGGKEKEVPEPLLHGLVSSVKYDFNFDIAIFGAVKPSKPIAGTIDLRGKTNLHIDAYLLRDSGLFLTVVGADTGGMHIAGSVSSDRNGNYDGVHGNHTISLFGPTDPSRYKPYDPSGRFNIVVQAEVHTNVFGQTGYARDIASKQYMETIPLEAVLQAIERQVRPESSLSAHTRTGN
jgi:ADP-heptose:LPS heptosyltransferase